MIEEHDFVIVNVDDNDMNLLLIQTYLSTLHAKFVNFTDSFAALAYIQQNKCDLVIVDYMMPKMDGIQLTEAVKKVDPEIPVIMVTANSTEDAVQIKALKAGVNDFIIKPINKSILLNRIRNFMKLRQAYLYLSNQEKLLQVQVDKATENLQRHIVDLQIAQQITHLGSWTWDIMSGTLEWSDETYRIFGLEPQSIKPTYSLFFSFIHPDDRTKVQQAVDNAVYSKTLYDIKHKIIVNDKIKHVHERGNCYYNENGEPVYMVGSVYDITEVTEAYLSLERKEHETLRLLSKTAEFKDEETANHVKRVSEYAVILARHMGLDNETQMILRYAAPLHDIGKVGIPDHILLKPGKLEDSEMEVMCTHPLIGAKILEGAESPYLKAGMIIALSHHEKFDGSGYPHKIRGDTIHLYGRIVAIADVFDALTSKRPYKQAWSFDEAFEYMKEQSGKHFDPHLIQIFTKHIKEFHKIYTDYKD